MEIARFKNINAQRQGVEFNEILNILFEDNDNLCLICVRDNYFFLDPNELKFSRNEFRKVLLKDGIFSMRLDNKKDPWIDIVLFSNFQQLKQYLILFWNYLETFYLFPIDKYNDELKFFLEQNKNLQRPHIISDIFDWSNIIITKDSRFDCVTIFFENINAKDGVLELLLLNNINKYIPDVLSL